MAQLRDPCAVQHEGHGRRAELRKGALRSGSEEGSQTRGSVGLQHRLPGGSDEGPATRGRAPRSELGMNDLMPAWTEGSKRSFNLLI